MEKKPLTFYPGTYIHSEALYTDSTGIAVIIQNSLPKGGGYIDAAGKKFGHAILELRKDPQAEPTRPPFPVKAKD